MSEHMIAIITAEESETSTEDILPCPSPINPGGSQGDTPKKTGSVTARPSAIVRSISSLHMRFDRHSTSPNLNQSHAVSRS